MVELLPSPSAERREEHRAFVGPDQTVSFSIGEHVYAQVRVMNLSLGGCFIAIPARDLQLFGRGSHLEGFHFENPRMPHDPFDAEVAFAIGSPSLRCGANPGGAGLHFMALPPDVLEAIRRLVEPGGH